MKRPKQDPFATPTRLDTLGDFLIGYSQADPSKPLGTQFGQAAASMSAKQAKQRQQRLANEIARRRLALEKRGLDIKAKKSGILTQQQRIAAVEKIQNIVDPEKLKDIRDNITDPFMINFINKQLKDPSLTAKQARNKGSVAATIRKRGS